MKVKDICDFLGTNNFSITGDEEREFSKFSPIHEASWKSMSFCDDPRVGSFTSSPLDIVDKDHDEPVEEWMKDLVIDRIYGTNAGTLVIPGFMWDRVNELRDFDKTFILTDNPRMAFMNLMNATMPIKPFGIASSAKIADCVEIGNNVSIGPYSVIGMTACAFRRKSDDTLVRFPQKGKVIIKDNVGIHSNVCIDRGALGDTVIGEGTKIDNLVHIAHNVKIGKNCMIVANAMIAGSVVIGDNSWIAPSASILNGVKIGSNCVVGMGSVVVKDVPNNTTVKGNPAK